MSTIKSVEKMGDYPGAVFYKTTCSCGEHNLTLEVEKDKKINLVSLNIYVDTEIGDFYKWDNWYQMTWFRIKTIFKIILCHELRFEAWFLFRGKEHIEDLITALREGMEKLKE